MNINQFLGKLNSYESDNIWQDVIFRYAHEIDDHPFSEEKSCDGDSSTIYFDSGLEINYDHQNGWEINQSTCDHDMKLITDDDGKCYPYETRWSYWECEICGLTKEAGPHDCYDPEF